jgi:TonB family protein
MKKQIILIWLLLFNLITLIATAQDTLQPVVFTIVEKMPSFPGGDDRLVKYLQKNIRYPAFAREHEITGTVFLTFVVTSEGKISQIKLLRGVASDTLNELANEAIRVLSIMPAWNPGTQNDKPVYVQYNLPVRFSLKGVPAESNNPDNYTEGNKFFKEGNYELALQSYDKAISENKNNINAFYNRGVCNLKLNRNEQACIDFKSAVALGDKESQSLIDKFCK